MNHLQRIRLIEGYYPSQFAMQYAAYVYLKEQMGVDVTFYPENDPNALFKRYAGYVDWCNISNSSTCSRYAPYPQFYFEDIKNDQYDLLFEIWDVMVRTGKGNKYFEDDSVLNAGISGVYGEGGWFIPKYMYDNNPNWILPQQLKYNETLRQIFIDAYTINSNENYIDKWWRIWNSKLDVYLPLGYGTPNYSKPIVFGSYHGYAISKYSAKLVKNLLGNGINWTFAAFGNESSLTSFVIDLYSKGLPFIANLYSPHLDFATNLPNTTGYMQFERIALPRNTNNDVDGICYDNGECAFPLSPLIKIGNPRIQTRFEEIYRFLLAFQMTTNDVNDIIAYHTEASIYNLSNEHQVWINATCKWLKQHKTTTDKWHQDIIRYDCIFNDGDGEERNCGFNYYYTTYQDAINNENKIIIPWYDSIGGSCTNDTNGALCNCQHEFLGGNTCRDSCPGIIGPIYETNYIQDDGRNNSHVIRMDNFTFYLCNNKGICNIEHKSCECQLGFGGDECDITFQVFQYATGFILLWSILFIICIIILILSIFWVYKNKHYKTIRAISPNLTILFTFGLILLCIGTILYLLHPLNHILCNIRNYFYGVGAIITIMAPLCKTFHVTMIFVRVKNWKKIEITDKTLLIYLIYAVVIETFICILYTILHEMNGGVEKLYLNEYNRIQYVCNQSMTVLYIHGANYLYIFTLIIVLCFLSFKNRSANKVFKIHRCAYFGSFFSLFVFCVIAIFNVMVDDMNIFITIQSGAMLIVISVIWYLFYAVRIYKFYMFPDDRSMVHDTEWIKFKNVDPNYTKKMKAINGHSISIDADGSTKNTNNGTQYTSISQKMSDEDDKKDDANENEQDNDWEGDQKTETNKLTDFEQSTKDKHDEDANTITLQQESTLSVTTVAILNDIVANINQEED